MIRAAVLFDGEVMHRRFFPVEYRFKYRIFSLLIDIDQLGSFSAQSRVLSRNRFNILSFHDRDHGPKDGTNLRHWIDNVLINAGVSYPSERVELLCMPRYLGFAFNPLSIWFCYRSGGDVHAILCEVRNTFGESHCYLLHKNGDMLHWPVKSIHKKHFHVSPFISMDAEYRFCVSPPMNSFAFGIREFQDDKCMLSAVQTGKRKPATTGNLLRSSILMPLMTIKVVLMIHWNALLIWAKGAKFHRKPNPPETEVSV